VRGSGVSAAASAAQRSGEIVLDVRDPGGGLGRLHSGPALRKRVHVTVQVDRAVLRRHPHGAWVEIRRSLERFADSALDLNRLRAYPWLHGDQIPDVAHSRKVPDLVSGSVALKRPLDLAAEDDVAVVDLGEHRVRDYRAPLALACDRLRNVRIVPSQGPG
jgi:hypothetical protein